MATEQTAMKLIERLIRIDDELTRGEQPGLYDHLERLFPLGKREDVRAWTYGRTGAEWYDKRLHPMQIARLIHLITTDAAGTIICEMLERIIRCNEDGGIMHRGMDARTLQAKRLWAACWEKFFGETSFADYLASIPQIPLVSANVAERFPHLMLVDARNATATARWMANVRLDDDDAERVFHDPWNVAGGGVYWLRYRSEILYRHGPTPKEYAASLKEPERRLTLYEGLLMCVHDFKKRRTLPMALSGVMADRDGSPDPDRYPIICMERVDSVASAEHHELQVPSCLPPEL